MLAVANSIGKCIGYRCAFGSWSVMSICYTLLMRTTVAVGMGLVVAATLLIAYFASDKAFPGWLGPMAGAAVTACICSVSIRS